MPQAREEFARILGGPGAGMDRAQGTRVLALLRREGTLHRLVRRAPRHGMRWASHGPLGEGHTTAVFVAQPAVLEPAHQLAAVGVERIGIQISDRSAAEEEHMHVVVAIRGGNTRTVVEGDWHKSRPSEDPL